MCRYKGFGGVVQPWSPCTKTEGVYVNIKPRRMCSLSRTSIKETRFVTKNKQILTGN